MSFRTNDVEQISLFDSFSNLTRREQKALENSWAKVFAEEVFPKIDEKPFAVFSADVMIMSRHTELIYIKLLSKTIIKKSQTGRKNVQ